MTEFDIISHHTDKFTKALEAVLRRANQELQDLLFQLKTKNGLIVASDENVKWAVDFADKYYQSLDNAGFSRIADRYRSDFLDITKEINAAGVKTVPFNFIPKDRTTLRALQAINYEGLFRVSGEVASSIQRLAIENIMLETPTRELAAELRYQVEERLRRYAKTHIETATRQAVQKAEDISLDNAGIPKEERYWQYIGPLDDKTREECMWALEKGYFTDAERQEFEDTHGIRYNCRHKFNFIPVEGIAKYRLTLMNCLKH